ncbi:MAG: ATP-binding protein [Bacteroidales bacterium]
MPGYKKTYIPRPLYINRVKPYIDKDIIKVITGQRRVGKSYMLFQLMDEIREMHSNAAIIYINKELNDYEFIKNDKDLLAYIEKEKRTESPVFIFIDEVQDIVNFEKALRSLQATGNYNIFCTGSNANLLSGELASFLSGRYVEIKIYSLTYPEFLRFHNLQEDTSSLIKYLKYGGLPYLINLELEDDIVYDYLKNIYAAILFKDVVKRHNIRNVNFLEKLIRYIADNTGSIVSAKKISDFLKSQHVNISTQVILNYLSYLTEAFFIFKVERADLKGKRIFEIGEKYYFEDLGLRHSIAGYRPNDINKILENAVYQHLAVSGYQITVGQLENQEIDFVCEKPGGDKIYVQVAYQLPDEKARMREFGNLEQISDNYPKYVVSMDELLSKSDYKGIKHLHIQYFIKDTLSV